MQRLRAMGKRKLPKEMPQGKSKEVENLREEMRHTPNKTKFGQKATKDDESSCESDEELDLRTILISTFPISLKCSTNFTRFVQAKRNRGKPRRGRERTFLSTRKA